MSEEKINKEKAINPKHSRFQDATWYGNPQEIIVGGAGGIGSWTALLLSRIGHTLYLFDMDLIEEHNMAGQLYATKQIGRNKAEAIKETIKLYADNDNIESMGKYEESSPSAPIVFSCFDNMAARKLMFNKWKEQEDRLLFVDGRMLAEVGMVYCVVKGNEEAYEAELFDDAEVKEAPCSFKATSHCGALIGSLMVAGLNNFLANVFYKDDIRVVPFKLEFELPMFAFTEREAKEFIKPKEEKKDEVARVEP